MRTAATSQDVPDQHSHRAAMEPGQPQQLHGHHGALPLVPLAPGGHHGGRRHGGLHPRPRRLLSLLPPLPEVCQGEARVRPTNRTFQLSCNTEGLSSSN